jgi:flagellar assembly factor FliW
MMNLSTTRFGTLAVDADDVIRFPHGLPGLEECRRWVLLADTESQAIAWLQSVERQDVALAVVSPRRFVPAYQIRVARRELEPLELESVEAVQVLVVLCKTGKSITLNLKAPLLINPNRRLGRQIVTNSELPVQYELGSDLPTLKKSA